MNTEAKVMSAVRNNSQWCDAVCRAHQVPGEFHDAYWVNRGKVPPYTSKLISLAGQAQAATQLEAIRSLIASEPALRFSVKDAFQCLDLALLGFEVLFKATWIYWAPGDALPSDSADV